MRLLHILLALQTTRSVLGLPSNYHRDTTNPAPQKPNATEWGNLIVNNHCPEPLNLWSVGVWHLNGTRDPAVGFGTPEEEIMHTIPSNGTFTEPLRVTCPYPKGWTMEAEYTNTTGLAGYEQLISKTATDGTGKPLTAGYCTDEDKLAGQGVAIKISRGTVPEKGKLLQFEYALVKDENRGDTTHRINYDVSLLDCGPEHDNITDFSATTEQHQEKLEQCPGYDGGLSLTFPADPEAKNCPPTYCDGVNKCYMAYLWDRTRAGESSLSCETEYHGDMVLDLCLGKASKAVVAEAKGMGEEWIATANNLPSGVVRPDGATAAAVTGMVPPREVSSDGNPTLSIETSETVQSTLAVSETASPLITQPVASTLVETVHPFLGTITTAVQQSATGDTLPPGTLNATMSTAFAYPTQNDATPRVQVTEFVTVYVTASTNASASVVPRGVCNDQMYYATPCVNS